MISDGDYEMFLHLLTPPDRTSMAPWAGAGVVSLQGVLHPVVSSVCDERNQEPSGQKKS